MKDFRERVPVVLRNVRSTHTWRPLDMLNWHRMVRPLQMMARREADLDVYQLVYELCTRLAIAYKPHATAGAARIHPHREADPFRGDPGEPRVAIFVDAPDHMSGVATTLTQWAGVASSLNRDLTIHCSGVRPPFQSCVCFAPVGTLKLAAYDGLQLNMPRVEEVLCYTQEESFDIIHVSTPGPMGLLGVLAARSLGVPLCGTFHTDFPEYAVRLTGDPELGRAAWHYMKWFYGQMDLVAAPSPSTRRTLIENGLDPRKLAVVGRGVRTEAFSPARRDDALRAQWGLHHVHKLLYVGRVSKEKNLSCLTEAFRQLSRRRRDVCLVIVGDGPYLQEMMKDLAGLPVHFTGVQRGEELARIYASCDLFVFSSETDTLGVVLLEAQASGLPVAVSARGGPKDCLLDGLTGVVVQPMEPTALCSTLTELLDSPERLAAMRERARAYALTRTPEASFHDFWQMHRALWPSAAVKTNPGPAEFTEGVLS